MACNIYTQLFIVIFWLFLLKYKGVVDTTVVKVTPSADILKFWEPDPQFDTRRLHKNTRNKDEKNTVHHSQFIEPINDIEKGRGFRYQKQTFSNAEDMRFRAKHEVRHMTVKKPKHNKGMKGLRGGRPLEKSTQKFESTRITPMHLKQQDNEAKADNKGKGTTSIYEGYVTINPYSIVDQFKNILSEFSNASVDSTVLGRTASYNDILLLKITQRGGEVFRANDNKYVEKDVNDKKIIFIVHALSPMGLSNLYSLTLERYMKKLLSYYLAHLDKFDIYLMPLANPDGYIQNKNSYIYWNKNYSPQLACPGVDVDRNFDVSWNSSADQSSCNPHYPGLKPFSEPESRAVRDVFHSMSHKIVAYFHVHAGSYTMQTFKGDAILYPRGYTETTSDDDKYIDLKGEVDEAIKNANFQVMSVTVDTLYNWYGPVFGSSVDYASSVYGIPYAMEMVMQIYQDPGTVNSNRILLNIFVEPEYFALTEIWSRLIDVVFKNIYKKLNTNENGQ